MKSMNRILMVGIILLLSLAAVSKERTAYDLKLKPTPKQRYCISEETRWVEKDDPQRHELKLWKYEVRSFAKGNESRKDLQLWCNDYSLEYSPNVSIADRLAARGASNPPRQVTLTRRNRYGETSPPNELFQVPLPGSPVHMGDTWSWHLENSATSKAIVMEWKCRLAQQDTYHNRPVVRIDYSWTYKYKDEEPFIEAGGHALFDPQEGEFLKKLITSKMKRTLPKRPEESTMHYSKIETFALVGQPVKGRTGQGE